MTGWRVAVFTITSIAAIGCSRDPARTSQAYLASGDAYAKAGQYKEAAIQYRNAAKVTPQSSAAHEKLADVSMHEHDRDTAAIEYLRAADLDPGNGAAQVRAASIYLLAGRFAEARDFAQAALRISPREVSAHVVLGEALNALHDATRGEASLREAVAIAPQSPDAHVALGSLYWSVGRLVDAEAELKRAVALAPAHAGADRALGLFYMATSRADAAEDCWKAVAKSPGGDPLALADYYAATGRLAESEHELATLAHADSTFVPASLRLASVQNARGERPDALVTIGAVLKRDPHNVVAQVARARLLASDGHLDEALADAGAAARTNVTAATMVGMILEAQGKRDAARHQYEETVAKYPHAPVAANNLACIYLEESRLDDALAQALVAHDEMPDSPEANDTLGWIYIQRHEAARAQNPLQAAVKARPDNQTYRSHLAVAQTGQP
jgi:tetratricopeptide (TPR) repeat protein